MGIDLAVSFKYTKYRCFICCASTSFLKESASTRPLTLLASFCSQLRAKRSKSNFHLFQSKASRRACELEISPENLDIFSHSLDIRILISLKILHRVASEILVKFDIFDASISSVKYFRISLNLASEIPKWTIYLFFNFATLVTFQDHSIHRNLLLLMFALSSVEPYLIYYNLSCLAY